MVEKRSNPRNARLLLWMGQIYRIARKGHNTATILRSGLLPQTCASCHFNYMGAIANDTVICACTKLELEMEFVDVTATNHAKINNIIFF